MGDPALNYTLKSQATDSFPVFPFIGLQLNMPRLAYYEFPAVYQRDGRAGKEPWSGAACSPPSFVNGRDTTWIKQ